MKKDYVVEAVKAVGGGIYGIILTLWALSAAVSNDDTFAAIGFTFLAFIFGICTFGCACLFIENITSAIAEKSKRG